MIAALVLGALGLVLVRSAFAPEPDPRQVLADLLSGQGLSIGGGGGTGSLLEDAISGRITVPYQAPYTGGGGGGSSWDDQTGIAASQAALEASHAVPPRFRTRKVTTE